VQLKPGSIDLIVGHYNFSEELIELIEDTLK